MTFVPSSVEYYGPYGYEFRGYLRGLAAGNTDMDEHQLGELLDPDSLESVFSAFCDNEKLGFRLAAMCK